MKMPRIAEAIGKIDEELIAESEEETTKKSKISWIRLGVAAACLGLAVSGILIAGNSLNWFKPKDDLTEKNESVGINSDTLDDIDRFTSKNNENIVDHNDYKEEDYIIGDVNTVAYGFSIEGQENLLYYPISFTERKKYNLLPEDAQGLTPENSYMITEKDLGTVIGIVGKSENSEIVGKTVYHFSEYPDSSSICIVDNAGQYEFYTSYGYFLNLSEAKSSDVIMTTYGLPDACVQVNVGEQFTINDIRVVKEICNLLSGCENIGLEASERLFAKAWFDAYGNDDVFYSEASGVCAYRNTETYEIAHELWNKGEKCFYLKTKEDFSIFVDYFPSIGVFFVGDGQFLLNKESVDRLNLLLSK